MPYLKVGKAGGGKWKTMTAEVSTRALPWNLLQVVEID